MMDHIRQRDWNYSNDHYKNFVEDRDIHNCVVERIIRNQFWDPMISSEEDEPPGPIDWDNVFGKSNSRESAFRRFVPGYRKPPPHPKLSALTQDEHRHCIKVLSGLNPSIMPREFVGKACKADWKVFEEKKEIYANEQKEFIEWARQLWTTTHCIRALRPKPLVEQIYDAEFKLKSLVVQGFPKHYTLAAQIPLRDEKHTCGIVFPKSDLIKVDISQLPQVKYPDIYESKQTILQECPMPEPCPQHPCRFQLPNESEVSLLPLPELHKELAQFAFDNGAMFLSSESALACLLDPDRVWSLPLSVCAVLTPEGDTRNVVVLGSEYPEKREPGPVRSQRAFRRMMLHAFTGTRPKPRMDSECSDSSHMSLRSMASRTPNRSNTRGFVARSHKMPLTSPRAAVAYNTAARKVAHPTCFEASDDSDDDRLEIVMDDDTSENNNNLQVKEDVDINITEELNKTNENSANNQPRKILRARQRTSTDKTNMNQSVNKELNNFSNGVISPKSVTDDAIDNQDSTMKSLEDHNTSGQTDPGSSKTDSLVGSSDEAGMKDLDVSLPICICKGTQFEMPLPRSYKNVLLKNLTTKEQLNVIVHSSHKLRNSCSEVLLEPFLEYQLELGGAGLAAPRARALAFSLMLHRGAELAIVRVDGSCGEVVTVDAADLRGLASRHGDMKPDVANMLYTALAQLPGLLPGAYVLRHEPSHGSNALLYSRAFGDTPGSVPLQMTDTPLTPAEEARVVQTAPPLEPFLLPLHKYRRQLPLAFTYNSNHVAKEPTIPINKKKAPPPAIQWPKKKGRKKGKKK